MTTADPVGAPTGRTNDDIQRLIDDAAARGGGDVRIPPGVYTLRNAVKLRSNVRVIGEGGAADGAQDGEAGVVLRKNACVSSPIVDFLGYGHYEFTAAEPNKFNVGDGVHLLDDNAMGFYTTIATIVERRGDLFYLDRMLNHDYLPKANGRAVTLFPPVEGCDVENASIENVTIDGNADANERLNGCRGGGVFLIGCANVDVLNLEVTNYNGDAVSFQQCTDIRVDGCRLHHNRGAGLHPGSGSVRYEMSNNHVHNNNVWGLFYCLRTSHSICRGNTFERNGDAGISIGERDTDHLIEGNTIVDNGYEGVSFREPIRTSGNRTHLRGNTLRNNLAKKGRAEIDVPAGLADVWIDGNDIQPRSGKAAVHVAQGAERVYVTANDTHGAAIKTPGEVVTTEPPADFPPIGPAALPADGARHLNINALPSR